MDGQRSIVFHNDSGCNGDYALFLAFPHIHCEDIGAMHTAAWITRYVPDGAHEQIDIEQDFYAWHTTQDGPFSPGTVLEDGTSHLVTLGTKKAHGSSFTTAVHRGDNTLIPQSNAAPNDQFEIHAQSSPRGQELLGVGKRGDDGSVVPVTAFQATPGFSYGVSPQPQLYLARFDRIRVGELVDLRASWKKACIDFSSVPARGHSQAIVTALSSGRFEVSYRSTPARPASSPQRPSATPSVGALARQGLDRWSGSIGWPDTATSTSVIQGSGMVIEALGCKYKWSVNTSQTESGGVSMRVCFWLRDGGRQPDYLYEEDWKSAVRGLQEQKEAGLLDLGCFPNTPCGSFSRLPVISR